MATIFVQEAGDVIEWTAAADITADDFVDVGGKLGIALASCLSGEKVSVKLTGVIRATKVAEELVAGASANATLATNTIEAAGTDVTDVGIVTETAAIGDATVLVRLNA